MALWVAVHGFKDQEDIVFDVLNRPVFELTERTNYLYDQISSMRGSGAFESVRITDAPLDSESYGSPVAGDFVYLNETTGLYTRALADISPDTAFDAANSSFAVGMVVSQFAGKATIVLFGREPMATNGAGWDLSNMLQPGELFRNGPYYLSSTHRGKMTSSGSGVSIYLGYFTEAPENPGYGGQALISPQYKDLKSAHIHRAYPLSAQPAGTQYVSGPTPVDTHSVRGFEATDTSGPDRQPRLVALGTWTGISEVQYTIWLSNSPSPLEILGATAPPTSWSDLYLHWSSSNANEGTGVKRLWSFDTPVNVGVNGLVISMENPDDTQWDVPYDAAADSEAKRTWVIAAPTQTRGWLARYYRKYFDVNQAVNGVSFILSGGPHQSSDGRVWDNITLKCGALHRVVYASQPDPGDIITLGGTTIFEFTNTGIPVSGGDYLVNIGSSADITYRNMVTQITQNMTASGYDAALNTVDKHLMIVAPTGGSVAVSVTGGVYLYVADGEGVIGVGPPAVSLLVYDEYHTAIVPSTSYWPQVVYWEPVTLSNGLRIMAIPYDDAGNPAVSDVVSSGDSWGVQFRDEAPGSSFVYAMGMHTGLLQYYPPVPLNASVLVLNGIELANYDQFPDNATYRLGPTSIYWFSNQLQTVPWPVDWVSIDDTGDPVYTQNLLMHFIKLSAGEAGIVTSLRPAPNSPIRVLQCGTSDPGTVGDLSIDVDLELQEDPANLAGFEVFKRVSGRTLRKGPMVEKIISTDGSVTIASSAGAPGGQGVVNLTIGGQSYSGDFEEVALQNAKQELIGMFPYIRLMGWQTGGTNNIPSGFVAKFRVPHDIGNISAPPSFKVLVYMTVFGEVDIPWVGGGSRQFAGIDFSYSILPDFTQISIDPSWPVSPGEITTPPAWNTLNTTLPGGLMSTVSPIRAEIPLGRYDASGTRPIYTAYDPMLIHNNSAEGSDQARRRAQVLGLPLPTAVALGPSWNSAEWGEPLVRPGSLVAIRVARSGVTAGPEYTGSIGFINLRWKLVGV